MIKTVIVYWLTAYLKKMMLKKIAVFIIQHS